MARLNVYLPDELAGEVKRRLPGLNVSETLQEALRALFECRHHRTVCAACSAPVDLHKAQEAAVRDLLVRFREALYPTIQRGGTAEGAARVLWHQAELAGWSAATKIPLPRPTRAERHTQKVRDFPGLDAPRRATA